jgi:hypothetical protein
VILPTVVLLGVFAVVCFIGIEVVPRIDRAPSVASPRPVLVRERRVGA